MQGNTAVAAQASPPFDMQIEVGELFGGVEPGLVGIVLRLGKLRIARKK